MPSDMELKTAIKEQYHGGLAMLAQCVERCPPEVWTSGKHPRTFWRIAFHAAFYTHLYLGQSEEAYQPWAKAREGCECLWGAPGAVEPYELPPQVEPYTQQEITDYIAFVGSLIDSTVDGLDLSSAETGFHWYKYMTKLSHELMNLRHIQGHIGQLSELLMMHGIDTDWVAKAGTCRRDP